MNSVIITDIMVRDHAPFIRKLVHEQGRSIFPERGKSSVLFMDGASWHVRAVVDKMLEKMGMAGKDAWAKHAANSPDLQAAVEWAHALLKKAVRLNLVRFPTVRTAADVRRLIELTWAGGAFKAPGSRKPVQLEPVLTAQTCKAMFDKMAVIYAEVKEAGGGWSRKGR